MEPLFKFLLSRPVEAKSVDADAIVVKVSLPFAKTLQKAFRDPDRARSLHSAAATVLERAAGPAGQRQELYTEAAHAFVAAVRSGEITTVSEARSAIETGFGTTVATLIQDQPFTELTQNAADQLAAIKYRGRIDQRAEPLAAIVRTAAYVTRLAAGGDDEDMPLPADWMQRVIVLDGLEREPAGREPAPERPAEPRPEDREALRRAAALKEKAALADRRHELEGSLAELSALPSDRLLGEVPVEEVPEERPSHDERGRTAMMAGRVAPPSARIALARTALEDLSSRSRRVVEKLAVAPERTGLVEILRRGEDEMRALSAAEARLDMELAPQTRTLMVGGGLFTATTYAGFDRDERAEGAPGVPATRGEVSSVGIGDLLVVKQTLNGYEARELSHVDNILKGEHRSLSTKRTRTTEETIEEERETTVEEERDQQSTERFEMQREASKVQKEDDSLKIGTSLSGSYGPMVEFKVTTDFGMSSSKEESTKAAENYSKEVVNRASTKVTERVRRMTRLKTVESFEEENVHEWNNVEGTDHVVGQYQWLDKLYEAQVFNYGSRMLFDLVVPEPAAFIHHTLKTLLPAGAEIVKPIPFTLDSDDITIGNYAFYAHRYDAEGIEAPPEPIITVSKVFEGNDPTAEAGQVQKSAEVPINDGYEAMHARAHVATTNWEAGHKTVLSIGTLTWIHAGPSVGWREGPLNKQQKSITCTLLTWRVATVVASIEITCNRTAAALEKWRIKTHAAIKKGYLKQLKDYEDAIEAAKAQASAETRRRNPSLNALLQREELKKAVISVFTAQHYDSFNSIETGGMGLPQVALAEAGLEGPYIRFFEQAFEWEQMMFLYYPYFWGRKSRWVEASFIEDADFTFAAFMKAGAARVVVSVRPGFELAVAHFLETGQIWEGGDPPLVTSASYLNIVDEIKERQQAPGAEVAVGAPWEVRLPTTLIALRKKDSLPRWQKNAAGEWEDAT